MDERRWHLEHSDGRLWTKGELTELIRGDLGGHVFPKSYEWWNTCIDQNGCLILLDTWGGWHVVMDSDDMVVVWDE